MNWSRTKSWATSAATTGSGAPLFCSNTGVLPFLNAANDRLARIYYFGLGLDPLSLRPEILTCMVLDSRALQDSGINLCFETSTFEGEAALERFGPEQLRKMAAREDVVAGSATCMLLFSNT